MPRNGLAATSAVHDLSAVELLAGYRAKTLSPLEVARDVLAHIERWEPHLHATYALDRAAAYYPGDDLVDWTCVDAYAGSELTPMADLLKPFLRWAAARPKPIMIGEYGVSRAWSPRERANWLLEAAAVFRANPQIKAALYFESNPDDRLLSGEFSLREDPLPLSALRTLATTTPFTP